MLLFFPSKNALVFACFLSIVVCVEQELSVHIEMS